MAEFETQVELAATLEELFDYLIRPANMVELAPPGTSIRLIAAPEILQTGSRVEFDVSGMGPTQRFVHEILDCARPERFVERQLEGPFRSFHHEAVLTTAEAELVLLVDRIQFEPPGGLVGLLLTEARIRRFLESGYAHRHAELLRLFSTRDEGGEGVTR
jgi:ligand-binding SRPBCC domain-containing protein